MSYAIKSNGLFIYPQDHGGLENIFPINVTANFTCWFMFGFILQMMLTASTLCLFINKFRASDLL